MKAPAAAQVRLYSFNPVDFGAVPQKNDLVTEVAQQQTEELDDPLLMDVHLVAAELHPSPSTVRDHLIMPSSALLSDP